MLVITLIAVLVLFLTIHVEGHRYTTWPHSLYGDQLGHRKPNIVFIMADDLGWNDVGFHNPFVKTPHIDKMARDGIELTNHYTQFTCTPICQCPCKEGWFPDCNPQRSRSALMTGRYPSNNGLQQLVILPLAKSCLPVEFKLLPEYMREESYVTKYIGKWHLGSCSTQCLPTNRGFDEYRGIIDGQSDYFTYESQQPPLMTLYTRYVNETPSFDQLGTHHSLVEKSDVREIIAEHKQYHNERPLFLVVSPTAPHSPLQVTDNMYNVHDTLTDPNQTERRTYLGLVSALDDIVGETIQSLIDAGLYDNSIIVFTSDNGGANSRLLPFLPGAGNNYPLRGQKADHYEGGVRVPTVYLDTRLPASTRGTKRDFLMHITDWLPTFKRIASRKVWTEDGMDGIDQGINLKSRYRSKLKYRARKEMLIGLTDRTSWPRLSNCSDSNAAYRYEDWKLITGDGYPGGDGNYVKPAENQALPTLEGDTCLREEDGKTVIRCLFNLKYDPLEQKNLYDLRPDIVRRLKIRLEYWRRVRVQAVFARGIFNENSNNTVQIRNQTVARIGFCDPATDFPLQPVQNPICFQNE